MSNELEIAFKAGFKKQAQPVMDAEDNPLNIGGGYDEERGEAISEGFEDGNIDEEGWLDEIGSWVGF